MSMSDDISCGSRDNKVECMSNANLFALYAKDLGKDNGRLLVLVLISNGTLSRNIVHKENVTIWLIHFSALQAHCPESIQKQRPWKIVDTLLCRFGTLCDYFSHYCSANQLRDLGTVSKMCKKVRNPSRSNVEGGQSSSSLVLTVIKTEVFLDCDDFAHKDLQLQQYGERIEKVSQQDILSEFLYGCRISECG